MTQYRLSGLRRVDELKWHDVEPEPGVYILFKTLTGPPRYVGRADTSLRRRLRRRSYRYYRYKHTDDEIEAYEWECKYFHRFKKKIRNAVHPARPALEYDLECRICGK